MDVIREQFIQLAAFIVELNKCSIIDADFENHTFNIDGPSEDKVITCFQMLDDFQTLYFSHKLCFRKLISFN